jgi:hypothetical protein
MRIRSAEISGRALQPIAIKGILALSWIGTKLEWLVLTPPTPSLEANHQIL